MVFLREYNIEVGCYNNSAMILQIPRSHRVTYTGRGQQRGTGTVGQRCWWGCCAGHCRLWQLTILHHTEVSVSLLHHTEVSVCVSHSAPYWGECHILHHTEVSVTFCTILRWVCHILHHTEVSVPHSAPYWSEFVSTALNILDVDN